jgi:hypothetical protein
MTNIIQPVFQITGPSKDPFPGHFCLPDLPLPKNASVQVGDNATLQVIQVALHGASLYNVSYLLGPWEWMGNGLRNLGIWNEADIF